VLPGRRYRAWKRTGQLPPIPTPAFWLLGLAAAFLAGVWWFSRP